MEIEAVPDFEVYGRQVRDIVGQAFSTPLLPGESLPATLRVFLTEPAGSEPLGRPDPPGIVLYVPSAGRASVLVPGGRRVIAGDTVRWQQFPGGCRVSGEYVLASAELGQYAGAARVALALAAYGPVHDQRQGTGLEDRLTAMAFPKSGGQHLVPLPARRPPGTGTGHRERPLLGMLPRAAREKFRGR